MTENYNANNEFSIKKKKYKIIKNNYNANNANNEKELNNEELNIKKRTNRLTNYLINKKEMSELSIIERYHNFNKYIKPTLPQTIKRDKYTNYILKFHGGQNKNENFKIPKNFQIISLEKKDYYLIQK